MVSHLKLNQILFTYTQGVINWSKKSTKPVRLTYISVNTTIIICCFPRQIENPIELNEETSIRLNLSRKEILRIRLKVVLNKSHCFIINLSSLGLNLKLCRRLNLNLLVILYCQVRVMRLDMSHFHKERNHFSSRKMVSMLKT